MSPDQKTKSESARINGAKSRGPITPAGRAKSSRNSLRHGLSAKSVVLPYEDAEQFEQLLEAYVDQFDPRTAVEMELVEAIAVARWRLRRTREVETSLLSTELERRKDDIAKQPVYQSGTERMAYVFKMVSDNSQSLSMLVRYEGALTRSYDRAVKQLNALQRTPPQIRPRQNEPTDDAQPEPLTPAEPATSRSEPSVPASPESSDPSDSRTADPTPGTSTSPLAPSPE
jgi:hypothetical protein